MEQIVTSIFAEISRCSHPWHLTETSGGDGVASGVSTAPLRVCVDSKAESLAHTTIALFETNPKANHRDKVKQLVREAISDCVESLQEVGYETSEHTGIQQCLANRGDRLVDMAVDMLSSDEKVDEEKVELQKKAIRCSRRRKSSRSERKTKKSSEKRVRWKKSSMKRY